MTVRVGQLADAAKALTNIDKVKDLNTLLGVMQEMGPHLEETRSLCAMLIQDKKDLERRIERQEASLLRVLGAQDRGLLVRYQSALEEWDRENPMEEVSRAPSFQAGMEESLQGPSL